MKNLSWFSVLQRVGQSLMVPVSVLPAAGLLVALGRILQNVAGPESHTYLKIVGDIAYNGGLAIFQQLPIVFAVGVAIGFTGGAGVAALAAVVGYFTLANVLTLMTTTLALTLKIDTGVFGGILVGLLTAFIYNKYHETQLHPVFGFFSGKRLVPILSVFTCVILGLLLAAVWPPVQSQIAAFGEWIMGSSLGPAFYAAGKRLLIPLGLHHVFYPPFLYQFGDFTTAAGLVVHGETGRYFAGDPTAGRFMASEFPLMLYGLPAAAFAMYLRAAPAKRKAVGGVMLAAALTSIITGITEPIEFSFIFVAPVLYVFHVIAAFISGSLVSYFDIHLGYTFSASLIDCFLGYFNQKNSLWLFAVIGPIMALMYFSVFYYVIGWFDIKTPGRGEDDSEELTSVDNKTSAASTATSTDKARQVLAAIGGAENILNLDACITRLRLEVKNVDAVNNKQLKKLGAAGVMKAGQHGVQIVFGVQSDALKDQIRAVMSSAPGATSKNDSLAAPLSGQVVKIENVPDETFSQKLMGNGFAIEPSEGSVCAPCAAEVVNLFPTGHAVGLLADNGAEILIHIGIDTVKMKGDGFKALVKVGDKVTAGQKLIEFSLDKIKQAGFKTVTPVVITNSDDYNLELKIVGNQTVTAGQASVALVKKK